MLQKIKLTIITLGLASGMTAGALFYLHNVDTCRIMVLKDLQKQRAFQNELATYAETTDFLTALTRGR